MFALTTRGLMLISHNKQGRGGNAAVDDEKTDIDDNDGMTLM